MANYLQLLPPDLLHHLANFAVQYRITDAKGKSKMEITSGGTNIILRIRRKYLGGLADATKTLISYQEKLREMSEPSKTEDELFVINRDSNGHDICINLDPLAHTARVEGILGGNEISFTGETYKRIVSWLLEAVDRKLGETRRL